MPSGSSTSQRRQTRDSLASRKRPYPTTRPKSRSVSPQETPEGCAAKLLEYTKIIMECSKYLSNYPRERDQIYEELAAQYPADPTIFDKPKETLDAMQTEYDTLLNQTSAPDSVRGYLMRMTYAHTAMSLYLSVQIFPRSATDRDFFKRWDAAYTRGNVALMEGRVATPGPYTAPLSELLAGPQSADKETVHVEPSRSEKTNTSVRHSRSLKEAKDLLKDAGTLLTKRFRYRTGEEVVDWGVVCIQRSRTGNQLEYVVKFSDDEAVFDEELVIDLLTDSVDVAHGDELDEIDVVCSQGSQG
ncbi:hypothetical protein Moror_9420 [Moniliophthora roreri MCA 2997]|uniref:Uncharacterized protein n=1 Tax=Moniliophthora roreri (strain MCA 2997) TaxID=1381753 RepID=V2Y303_MONRO|nr:hypothetical protein Moror_9420 [Moniliophthora roreri MCA 2997]